MKDKQYFFNLLNKISASNKDTYSSYMAEYLKDWDEEQIYRFIATCAVESGNFSITRESLFYSTAERLKISYPSKFKNGGYNPYNYLKNSKKLGNLVYANKLGNGNEASGDGFLYRGAGLIQLTGKDWFKKFSDYAKVDFVSKPDLMELPKYALLSAVFYWDYNNIKNKKTLYDVRVAVNGPKALGYKELVNFYNKLKS